MKQLLIFAQFIISLTIYAQPGHFAFFEEQATLLNPAFCGIVAPMKFTSGYRTQWQNLNDNYRSYGFMGEARLKVRPWKQIDSRRGFTFKHNDYGHFAIGLAVFNNEAGAGQLSDFHSQLTLSSFIQIDAKSIVSLGMYTSYTQRSIQGSKLIFPDQFSATGYSSQLPSQEPWKNYTVNFFNLGIGGGWHFNQRQFDDYSHRYFGSLGASVLSLLSEPSLLSFHQFQQFGINAIGWFHFPTGKVATVPMIQFTKKGSANEFVFGSMFRTYFNEISKYTGLKKQSWFGFGAFLRMKDAAIFRVQYQHRDQYAMGFGYEVTLSPFQQHIGTGGAIEAFIRYQPPRAFLYQNKVQE